MCTLRLLHAGVLASILFFPLSMSPVCGQPFAENCFQRCPTAKTENRVLSRSTHSLSNNAVTKFADWVAYEVVADDIGTSRRRVWRADPLLPEDETLEPADYKGANKVLKTDRGHQAPLASFTGTMDWRTTNYLSNITPQKSALNQGPWKKLESAVRKLAASGSGRVHVITGPLYEREMPSLPEADEPHRVPSGYWKIISLTARGTIEAAGFLLDQDTPRKADFCDLAYATPIVRIAERSGIGFAPGLESGAVNELRARLGCAPVLPSSPPPSS